MAASRRNSFDLGTLLSSSRFVGVAASKPSRPSNTRSANRTARLEFDQVSSTSTLGSWQRSPMRPRMSRCLVQAKRHISRIPSADANCSRLVFANHAKEASVLGNGFGGSGNGRFAADSHQ